MSRTSDYTEAGLEAILKVAEAGRECSDNAEAVRTNRGPGFFVFEDDMKSLRSAIVDWGGARAAAANNAPSDLDQRRAKLLDDYERILARAYNLLDDDPVGASALYVAAARIYEVTRS